LGILQDDTSAPNAADPILPCIVRHVKQADGGAFIGVRYQATTAAHFQLVADLLFANSDQWSAMQNARRVNPGLVRGTIWFNSLALREIWRGLSYLVRSARGARPTALEGQPSMENAR
jgi:cellulose synthase (UDP-forming)